MTASVVLDDRCRALRGQLSPAAWMVLEEAALTAVESDSGGVAWSPLSVRSVAARLGMGRASAAGALSTLVAAGLLRPAPGRRGSRGRFGRVGYWVTIPEGMVVVGMPTSSVTDLAVAGGHGHGRSSATSSRPDSTSHVAPSRPSPDERPRSRPRRRSTEHSSPASQVSLFGSDPATEAASSASREPAPPVGSEPVGAAERDGCEVVDWVHELAPGVPGGPDPHWNPNGRASAAGGGSGC